MDDIYEKVDIYNPYKKLKILHIFDDMIGDMVTNKKLSLIVTDWRRTKPINKYERRLSINKAEQNIVEKQMKKKYVGIFCSGFFLI